MYNQPERSRKTQGLPPFVLLYYGHKKNSTAFKAGKPKTGIQTVGLRLSVFRLIKAGRKPLQLLSSVQNTLCIEYGKVRFIFCERVKRRPHRQRSSSVSIIIAARGREKLRIVGIIVIAGTQPDYTRLTALLYIVTQAQKKLNRFCHSERSGFYLSF